MSIWPSQCGLRRALPDLVSWWMREGSVSGFSQEVLVDSLLAVGLLSPLLCLGLCLLSPVSASCFLAWGFDGELRGRTGC